MSKKLDVDKELKEIDKYCIDKLLRYLLDGEKLIFSSSDFTKIYFLCNTSIRGTGYSNIFTIYKHVKNKIEYFIKEIYQKVISSSKENFLSSFQKEINNFKILILWMEKVFPM